MRVWSEKEVEALTEGRDPEELGVLLKADVVTEAKPSHPATAPTSQRHVGKYAAVAAWLVKEPQERIDVTFGEMEEILGFALPVSAYKHTGYWSEGQPGITIGNAIRDAGWEVRDVDLMAWRVTLVRGRVVG